MAFPSVSLLDNFTRADEGPPPSSSWVTSDTNGMKVVSNVCVQTNSGTVWNAATWNTSFNADQEVAIKISSTGGGPYCSVSARQQTNTNYGSNHYELGFFKVAGNDTAQIYKEVSSTFTQLGADIDIGGEWANGDTLGLRCAGTTIEAFRNGSSLGTRTDSSVSGAGYTALGVTGATSPSDVRYSEFYAGNYSAGTIPTSHHLLLLGVGS